MKKPRLPSMQLLDNDRVATWIFLTPALILLILFIIWPITYLFYLSFTAGSFTSTGIYLVGFRNYWRLFFKADF
jgi:multiple sugar transport system permease protein